MRCTLSRWSGRNIVRRYPGHSCGQFSVEKSNGRPDRALQGTEGPLKNKWLNFILTQLATGKMVYNVFFITITVFGCWKKDTFFTQKVTFFTEKVTFFTEKVTFFTQKVTFFTEQVTFFTQKLPFLRGKTFLHLVGIGVSPRWAPGPGPPGFQPKRRHSK